MLCVSGVYLRDITNTIFVILHLNVSHLSLCSSCFLGGWVQTMDSNSETNLLVLQVGL